MHRDESLRRELLAEVEVVAPILAEHAQSSEALGRLDAPSIDALRTTRLLRMSAPRDLGGIEVDPVTQLEVIEAVARADGAASWCVGILSGTATIVGAFLPAAASKRVFARGVPAMSGMVAPKGQAEPVDGGYRLKGRWAFGSGIHHAEWVIGGAFVKGLAPPAGIRLFVLPKDQVVVHDNWQVAGLKASGSSDYSIEDVFVPEEMSFSFIDAMVGKVVTGGAALRLGMPALVIPFHAGVALGIARRALDEITHQAIEKGRGLPPSPLPTHQHFQMSLGKAELELASARALAIDVLSGLWAEASAGRVPPAAKQAEARAAATYVTEVAQRVTTTAFQAAGGGALFDDNALQRCFRDVHAAGQHFMMSQTSYRALGLFKLGQPDANPML
jgi:alkylation response protein AidB-like acyl-CoA dehydrogenase